MLVRKKTLLVSHDAGGASLLAYFVKNKLITGELDFLLQGPAEKIFRDTLVKIEIITENAAENSLLDYEKIITSTSWAGTLEKKFLKLARKNNIPSITVLDHWTNYRKRFEYEEALWLPDTIWATDSHAKAIAAKEFPETEIELKQNYYREEVIAESLKYTHSTNNEIHILYCTEPTAEVSKTRFGHENGFGYTEWTALENFFHKLPQLAQGKKIIVRLRQHPSEPVGKYDSLVQKWSSTWSIELSRDSLAFDLGFSDWVVGCNSMVMAIGVFAKKKVFCAIPDLNIKADLPFSEIVRL